MLSGTTMLRVAAYNIAADIYSQGITTAPQPAMETILEGIGNEHVNGTARPIDILALEETAGNSLTVAPIVSQLNNHYGTGVYIASAYQPTSTGSLDGNGPNALVYNSQTLTLVTTVGIGIPSSGGFPRQPVRYQLRPVGGSSADDFFVYVSHYKSGDAAQDNNGQRRATEAQAIRADEATLSSTARVLYVGDFNIFSASDPGYVAITTAGQGQAIDPIGSPHFHDSQTPRVTGTESASSLSSRLDLQLMTQNVIVDINGLHYMPGSYHAFGNDGSVSNVSQSTTALSDLPNRTAVLSALVAASDHLPIVADYTDTITDPAGPVINSLTANPTTVTAGTAVNLTANNVVEFGLGTIAAVKFYRESNGTAGLQAGSDALLGMGVQNGVNWSLTASTAGLSGGVYTLYAQATDSSSLVSDPVSTHLTVNGPAAPTIGSLTVNPASVAAGASVTLAAMNVTRVGGTINQVTFYRESNGTSGLQAGSDVMLGTGTQGGVNWLFSTGTTGLAAGTQNYYAVATDSFGVQSAVSTVPLNVTAPPAPTIGSFSITPASLPAGDSAMLVASNVTIVGGATIAYVSFYRESNGTTGLQIGSDDYVGVGVQDVTTWTGSESTAGFEPAIYTYYAVATGDNGIDSGVANAPVTVVPGVNSTVAERNVFYNQSAWDGSDAAIDFFSDSLAIATDKTAYLPGDPKAVAFNVTSYSRGINGIIIDLSSTGGQHASITAADFVFKVGADNTPSGWAAAPAPNAVAVSLGFGGNDRVEITWAAGSIANKWLEVQMLANSRTGLATTDVFFWGNRIADSASGTLDNNNFVTNSTDAAQVFATLTPANGAAIVNLRDYNRDKTVNSTDAAIVFAQLGNLNRLLIESAGPFAPEGDGPAAQLSVVPSTEDYMFQNGGPMLGGAAVIPLGGDGRLTNHEALVVGTMGGPLPTFSIDSSGTLELSGNDLIGYRDLLGYRGSLATMAALAAVGRSNPPGGIADGNSNGNGLSSSAANRALDDHAFEQKARAVARSRDPLFGADDDWRFGARDEALASDDILAKHTCDSDIALDGMVADLAVALMSAG